ncbi:hypothetical protein BDZ45DRAFT_742012 [Acephala macrosclerotiorum]|nr:hypothetical protein BDZ45DRAFT_742012 [Acephala macrosclerotiorum]
MCHFSVARFVNSLAPAGTTVKSYSIWIEPPAYVPCRASQTVDYTFVRFAIQASPFTNIAGNHSHPNHFSQNLIQSIDNKANSLPVIRVFSAPFAAPDLIDRISITKLAVQNTRSGVLNAIEIGNEPDLYVRDIDKPAMWTVQYYVNEWSSVTSVVTKAIIGFKSKRISQAAALATPYDPAANLFQDGVDRGDIVESYAECQYETTTGFIINGLQQLKPTVSCLQTHHQDIGLVLGEQGRFYPAGAVYNTNLLGVFGSTL